MPWPGVRGREISPPPRQRNSHDEAPLAPVKEKPHGQVNAKPPAFMRLSSPPNKTPSTNASVPPCLFLFAERGIGL